MIRVGGSVARDCAPGPHRDTEHAERDPAGLGATFTLIAWAFTWLFILMQAPQPGSFAAAVDAELARTWTELMS